MIPIANMENVLVDNKCNNIMLYDTARKLMSEINSSTPEETYQKLISFNDTYCGYKTIIIKGGNDKIKAGNYNNAKEWKVFYPNTNVNTSVVTTPVNSGYSKEYVELSIAMEKMKLQMEYEKQTRELEKKYHGGEDSIEKYFKYAPLFGSLLGMSDDDMMKKLQMCNLAGGLNGSPMQQTRATENKLVIQGTELEKEKLVEQLVPSIYSKVDKDKFISVLNAINKNPEFIDSAYAYMSLSNGSTAMAGVPKNNKDYVPVGYVDFNNDDNF